MVEQEKEEDRSQGGNPVKIGTDDKFEEAKNRDFGKDTRGTLRVFQLGGEDTDGEANNTMLGIVHQLLVRCTPGVSRLEGRSRG